MQPTETTATQLRSTQPSPRAKGVVRVGIVGYGTVGRATAEILASHAEESRHARQKPAATVCP